MEILKRRMAGILMSETELLPSILSLTPSQHPLPPLFHSPPLCLSLLPNTAQNSSIRGRMLNREEPSGGCQNSTGKAGTVSPSHCHFGTAFFTPAKSHLCVCKTPGQLLTLGDMEKCSCLPLSLALTWCKSLSSPWKTLQRMSGCSTGFCSA